MITHKWTDRLVEGSTQDVTEDQKSQPLTFLQEINQSKKIVVIDAGIGTTIIISVANEMTYSLVTPRQSMC